MSSVAENVHVAETPEIAEHAEDVAEQQLSAARPSILGKLDKLSKGVTDLSKTLAHAELRHMYNNCLPHETIRQILSILDGYDPAGDVTWVMRSLRDQLLTYIRSLSIRYPHMQADEKIRLARAVTYEGLRRHVEPLNAAGERKFELMVSVGELIEADDTHPLFLGCAFVCFASWDHDCE